MDALTALTVGGLGGLVGYCLAKGEPLPTEAQLLKALEENKPRLTQTIQIDTTVAHDKKPYPISGQSLFVLNPQDPSQPVYIHLNEPESDRIELTAQRTIKAPFYRFYITNEAGTGTLTIIVNKASVVELNAADINVNIVAQAINNLLMTFNAQNVGVYIGAEWESKQGNLTCMGCGGWSMSREEKDLAEYNVPSGKAFYIYNINGGSTASNANESGDANQIMRVQLTINSQVVSIIGGNGGCATTFSTPFKVSAHGDIKLEVWNYANHDADTWAWLSGFEVTV